MTVDVFDEDLGRPVHGELKPLGQYGALKLGAVALETSMLLRTDQIVFSQVICAITSALPEI